MILMGKGSFTRAKEPCTKGDKKHTLLRDQGTGRQAAPPPIYAWKFSAAFSADFSVNLRTPCHCMAPPSSFDVLVEALQLETSQRYARAISET